MNTTTENTPGAWRPLLDDNDALREQACEAIDAISSALDEINVVEKSISDAHNASISERTAGFALLRAYAFRGFSRASDAAKAEAHLDHALDIAARLPLSPALYSGFTGIAWTLEHLHPDGDDPNEAVDEALLDLLDVPRWHREYDLISGLVGIGVYALERLPRFEGGGPAARCLTRVLDRLEGLAERSPTGICWFTPPRFLPPGMRRGQSQLL